MYNKPTHCREEFYKLYGMEPDLILQIYARIWDTAIDAALKIKSEQIPALFQPKKENPND